MRRKKTSDIDLFSRIFFIMFVAVEMLLKVAFT